MARVRLRTRTQRTALFLYAVLIVLPAAVFGGLLWRELNEEQATELAAAPQRVEEAGARLNDGMVAAIEAHLDRETTRSPLSLLPEVGRLDADGRRFMVTSSPLTSEVTPVGLVGWFHMEKGSPRREGLTLLGRSRNGLKLPTAWEGLLEESFALDPRLGRQGGSMSPAPMNSAVFPGPLEPGSTSVQFDLPSFAAALHPTRSEEGVPRCAFDDIRQVSARVPTTEITLTVSPFQLSVLSDENGRDLVVASRVISRRRLPDPGDAAREPFWQCLEFLFRDQTWVQGFLLEGDWIRHGLPATIAPQALESGIELVTNLQHSQSEPGDWSTVVIAPLESMGARTPQPETLVYYRLAVRRDLAQLRHEFAVRERWYLATVFVMMLSVAVGLWLLTSSLRASERYARRTENFVAAVTHELRTPIAAVKMYGEMLRDGWVTDPTRQDEYLGRILSESTRLSNLVERVLDKRKLDQAPPEAEPGDLAAEARRVFADAGLEGEPDVTLEVTEEEIMALLVPVGIRAVIVNLIENARKYAPVPAGGEPIQVRVSRVDGAPVLEVADRGAGIPAHERGKVLEAFVRLGDEATRSAKGTGLGLHLVAQFCQVMKARLELDDRPGGGLIVRIRFRSA